MQVLTEFTAHVVTGKGRGREMRSPTLNLDPFEAPEGFLAGVYACAVEIEGTWLAGALHFGLRPTFDDEKSLEVHVIDRVITNAPEVVHVKILKRLRDVKKFQNSEELQAQIQHDIQESKKAFDSAHD